MMVLVAVHYQKRAKTLADMQRYNQRGLPSTLCVQPFVAVTVAVGSMESTMWHVGRTLTHMPTNMTAIWYVAHKRWLAVSADSRAISCCIYHMVIGDSSRCRRESVVDLFADAVWLFQPVVHAHRHTDV